MTGQEVAVEDRFMAMRIADSSRRRRTTVGVATAIVGLAMVGAPSAQAAFQIGHTFDPTSSGNCGAQNLTLIQTPTPQNEYTVPVAGVVTGWLHRAGTVPPKLKLKVARHAGGSFYTIVGESSFETPAPNTLNAFYDVRISVLPGDVIGIYMDTDGQCGGSAAGYNLQANGTDVPPGDTAAFLPYSNQGILDVVAIVEPDCDSDGFGDESQDSDISACRGRTLTLDSNKDRVKKGKRVVLTGRVINTPENAADCESNQAVALQKKKPAQSTFTTVDQIETDAAGSFTARQEIKKTTEFRAQVGETADCNGGVSNVKKVKVKKEK